MTKPHDENLSDLPPLSQPESQVPETRDLEPVVSEPTTPEPKQKPTKVKSSPAGAMWAGLIVSALLLILLLVFILQNQQAAELNLFAWSWNFPIGVGMLFAAILGALITAMVGGLRMLDLRRQVKRAGLDK